MVLRNIRKSYNGRCVLELDELSLEKGKIYAVIGANGSGKSTLAKLAAGVLGMTAAGRRNRISVSAICPRKALPSA